MWLISPLSWLLLALLLASLASRFRPRARWPLRTCAVVAAVAVFAMTPLMANSVLAYLERPAPLAPECRTNPPSIVVVLGGGLDRTPGDARQYSVLNLASRRRLDGGLRYWQADPRRQIVLSGGGPSDGVAISHAELMGAYARAASVPGRSLRLEARSRNTWENAWNVAAMTTAGDRRIVLVTSALHMPRALFAFRSAGLEVCPLPVDRRFIPFGLPGYLIPQTSALVKTEAALHELVGLGYYRWLDWRRRWSG